jgi:hypothetical protein
MTARNGGDVPVSVDFDSEFGSRSVRTLQPGKEAEKLLPALQRSVQQGAVLATLSFDGTTVDVAAPYAAIACR